LMVLDGELQVFGIAECLSERSSLVCKWTRLRVRAFVQRCTAKLLHKRVSECV
jgi:hypothetical protein